MRLYNIESYSGVRVSYRRGGGGRDPRTLPSPPTLTPLYETLDVVSFLVHKLLMIATVAMVGLFRELLACRVRLEWIIQVWWPETACGLAMCM